MIIDGNFDSFYYLYFCTNFGLTLEKKGSKPEVIEFLFALGVIHKLRLQKEVVQKCWLFVNV